MNRIILLFVALMSIAVSDLVTAKTLRWAAQGDYLTGDPHAQNEGLTNSINGHVYEGLVTRGKKLEIVPQLATSWKMVNPTTWVFNLRKNVKFHDGTPLTADDVVFSLLRAQGESSTFRVYANGVGVPSKIDAHTVQLVTPVPNPVQLEMLVNLFVMSKAWAQKNNCLKAQDTKNNEESYASRNANGTGPFKLVRRDPDVKTILKKNDAWWGIAEKRFEGNVTDVIFTPIQNDATRISALQSGNLDFVLDPALQNLEQLKQNPALKVIVGPEIRSIFFGMDQFRDELQYSDVKGKNPFKDIRVRRALYQAIDADSIKKQVMRGYSVPTGIVHAAPDTAGIPVANQKRLSYDVATAKKLLTEAGYPKGFSVTLDCPNNRYINDERICLAVAGMLAKIDVKVTVNAMPRVVYFAKQEKFDTSFYMLGWGGSTTDPIFTLQPVFHSLSKAGDGTYNYGRVSDPKLDTMIDTLKGEMDAKKRHGMLIEAMKYHTDQIYHIPLHRQMIPWAARANVDVVHRSDNWLEVPWVHIR